MTYCTRQYVKEELLHIEAADTTYDDEIDGCIASSDALIDAWLKEKDLTMPTPVPKNLEDASAYVAAWLFRRRRASDDKTASFWTEATRFFNAHVNAQDQLSETPYVGSA